MKIASTDIDCRVKTAEGKSLIVHSVQGVAVVVYRKMDDRIRPNENILSGIVIENDEGFKSLYKRWLNLDRSPLHIDLSVRGNLVKRGNVFLLSFDLTENSYGSLSFEVALF